MTEPERCPKCGAEITWRFEYPGGLYLNFACETALRGGDIWIWGSPCYERQLAAKDALLREAVEVIKKVRECPSIRIECSNCRGRIDDFLDNTEIKALMKEGG